MAYAELDGAQIVVQTAWSEKEAVRQVPGSKWDADSKTWRIPVSWASCLILRGVFKQTLTIGPELNHWAALEQLNRVQPAVRLRTMTAVEDAMVPAIDGLYPFQQADVEWLSIAGDALLCNDMGTGKTVSALASLATDIADFGHARETLPALVICPNSVKIPWARAAERWLPQAVPYVIRGTASVRAKTMAAAVQDPNALIIVNIESVYLFSRLAPFASIRLRRCRECDRKEGEQDLPTSRCEMHPKALNAVALKTVILDEAHRIKDARARQTRACWAVMHQPSVRRRLGLTGTVIANHPGDLWSVMHGVAPADFPLKSKFVDRYCLAAWNPYGVLDVVGVNPEHREEFFRIVDPRMRRMPKELVLPDLPPKVRSRRFVEMSPKQAKAYQALERDQLARLDDGTLLTSPGNLLLRTRLCQLSSSYCTVETNGSEDPRDWKVLLQEPSPKVDELLVVMEELGDAPLAVCAQSKQLIMLASKRLDSIGIPHGLITGNQNEWERARHLDAFQGGHTRALLFTEAAGGTGLTMTRAGTIAFLQRSWSMVNIMQSEDRVHRIGSEGHESINIVDIVTQGTVEETVQIPRLYEKFERLQEIYRDRELLAAAGLSTDHLDREANIILSLDLGA